MRGRIVRSTGLRLMDSMPPAALDITDAVAAILAEADADIAARKPVCRASGRCCKFEEYGHRLYVTAAEMAYFEKHETREGKHETTEDGRAAVSLPQFFASDAPRGCPYQVDGLCTAREV